MTSMSLLNPLLCMPVCHRGLCANMLAWQCCLHANVVSCQSDLPANVAKSCQTLIFICQRAILHANVSTWCANVPKGRPIFQTFLLENAKGNFYTLLLHKNFYILLDSIIHHHTICICIIHENLLFLISILHVILKKSVGNFSFLLFFFFHFLLSS